MSEYRVYRIKFWIKKENKEKAIEDLLKYEAQDIKFIEEYGNTDNIMIECCVPNTNVSELCKKYNFEIRSTRDMKEIFVIRLLISEETGKIYMKKISDAKIYDPVQISEEEFDAINHAVNVGMVNGKERIKNIWFYYDCN